MKTTLQFALLAVMILGSLVGCGPSQAEQYATQTALAPTATLTATLTPSATPTLTPTATPTPTLTPTITPTRTATPIQDVDQVTTTYKILLVLDVGIENVDRAISELEQNTFDQNQANARIQIFNHTFAMMKNYAHLSPYEKTLSPQIDTLLAACGRWWRGKSDPQTLRQELDSVREKLQPLKDELRASLAGLGDVDLAFEQKIPEDSRSYYRAGDKINKNEAMMDIFRMQRDYRETLWGAAPVLGSLGEGGMYTAPDDSFQCKFSYLGIDGDLMYDFIFPKRTLVALTNDFGLGEAVERWPLVELPGDSAASKKALENLFNDALLPVLRSQHSGLKVLKQTWMDEAQPALQLIFQLPNGSYLVNLTKAGEKRYDVLRGMKIFIAGGAIYAVSIQESDLETANLTLAERIEKLPQNLTAFQQGCTFK